jgi:hypothetical protein
MNPVFENYLVEYNYSFHRLAIAHEQASAMTMSAID